MENKNIAFKLMLQCESYIRVKREMNEKGQEINYWVRNKNEKRYQSDSRLEKVVL